MPEDQLVRLVNQAAQEECSSRRTDDQIDFLAELLDSDVELRSGLSLLALISLDDRSIAICNQEPELSQKVMKDMASLNTMLIDSIMKHGEICSSKDKDSFRMEQILRATINGLTQKRMGLDQTVEELEAKTQLLNKQNEKLQRKILAAREHLIGAGLSVPELHS